MKTLFLILVVLISLIIFNINKEDITGSLVATSSSDVCASEPTPEILYNLYSQIPEYKGNKEQMIQAALHGWDLWTANNPGRATKSRDEIEAGLGAAGGGGSASCIDDYSLNSDGDCWNQSALCIEGQCKKFEDINWDNDKIAGFLEIINSPLSGITWSMQEKSDAITYLGRTGTDNAITLLGGLLIYNVHGELRHSASLSLADIETSKITHMTKLLIRALTSDSYSFVRLIAATMLGDINTDEAVQALRAALKSDESYLVREGIAEILGNIASLENVALLSDVIKSDPHISVRNAAAKSLGNMGTDEAVQELTNLLNLESIPPNLKVIIAGGLIKHGSEDAENYIIGLINSDAVPSAKSLAVTILCQIMPAEKSMQLLQGILLDPAQPEEVKLNAATCLAVKGTDETIQTLRYVLDYQESDLVRQFIVTMLRHIAEKKPREIIANLAKIPLFSKIYGNSLLEGKTDIEKNSITTSTYRHLLANYGENPAEDQISSSINLILNKRAGFEGEQILGKDTYFIVLSHEDPLLSQERVKDFSKRRGVKNFYKKTLKGFESKNDIKNAIINSNGYGKATIWAQVHGLPDYLCLSEGIPGEEEWLNCVGFRYDEFADILLQRGNLDEVILIIDSCFSYNFAEQLIESLKEKGTTSFPTIITVTNKDRFGYSNVFRWSLDSFDAPEDYPYSSLDISDKAPLLGRHIFEAEKFSYDYQDSAVLFSESASQLPPIEIAMNTLNPSQCGECTGDSCPIEPVEGISS